MSTDFHLKDKEQIIVVVGPNQGGKTTFACSFGQLNYSARIGLPVPGKGARLFVFDKLFTRFEREEDIHILRGKPQDDPIRIHRILDRIIPNSVVVMREIFTSTTLRTLKVLRKPAAGLSYVMPIAERHGLIYEAIEERIPIWKHSSCVGSRISIWVNRRLAETRL